MSGVEIFGREDELQQLGRIVAGAVAGDGRLVFLTSPTGGGKSTLIAALRERVEADELGEVEALRFVCAPSTPYGPFLELLSDLAGRDRKRIVAARAKSILTATAPLVLKAIPAFGELAAAGFTELMKSAEGGATMDAVSTQIAEALERIADEESPLLVILDEAHLIDEGSCEVVRRFVAEGVPNHLALVLSFDPQRVPDGHALRQLRSDAMLGRFGVDMKLAPLDESDVAEMMAGRWGAPPHPLLAAWVVDRCGGNAAFIVAFLRALEDAQVVRRVDGGAELDGTLDRTPDGWVIGGALAGAVVPASLKQLAALQAAVLGPDERSLLQEASIQGEQFAGRVLVEMLGADEAELRKRLMPLTERRLIAYDDDVWWNDRSVVWRFDPRVLHSAFYEAATESEYDRKQLHRRVADILEQIVADDARPPGRILLQLARHRREAAQAVEAAGWLLKAAQAAAAAGSWRGTYQLCRDALTLLDVADDDRTRAEATGLLLLAAGWFWDQAAAGEVDTLQALAESGEQAARRLGEPGPLARFLYGRGLLAYVAEGYAEAIRLLRQAEALAANDFDVVGRVLLMTRLGHARPAEPRHRRRALRPRRLRCRGPAAPGRRPGARRRRSRRSGLGALLPRAAGGCVRRSRRGAGERGCGAGSAASEPAGHESIPARDARAPRARSGRNRRGRCGHGGGAGRSVGSPERGHHGSRSDPLRRGRGRARALRRCRFSARPGGEGVLRSGAGDRRRPRH
jgi:hypothetical protein